MNDNLHKLMLDAGFAAPEIALRAQLLAKLVVYNIIKEVVKDEDIRNKIVERYI